MDLATKLGVVAGTLQFAGYIAYNIIMFLKKESKPNKASWLIWTYGSIASSLSYVLMSQGKAEDILPIVCAACCFLTFCHVLIRGERKKLDSEERLIVGVDIAIVIFWLIAEFAGFNGKATIIANLLFQAGTILSFRPIIKEVWANRGAETKLPWVIWSFAYATELGVLWVQGSSWNEWIYPAVCLPLHAIVAVIAKFRTAHA